MRKRKNIVSMLALVMVLMMAVTACSKDPVVEDSADNADGTTSGDNASQSGDTQEPTDTAASDSTFTYAIAGDPNETVNVITTSDRWGLTTVKMIYSPLYMYNADGINWFLAKDYETEDNLTYTFHLRDDVKWSDGEAFTADDVVFTYEKMQDESNLGWAYSQLVYDQGSVQVAKVDDYTVSFTFPFESPTSLEMLSQVFIMPKHIYENVTDFEHNEYNMNSVGTGPYQVVDYQAGSYVKFKANPYYFKGEPSISNVVFQIIEDSNTAMLALQNGEVDAYQATPAATEQLDLDANNLTAYSYGEGRIGYVMLNTNNVTDANVRKAIFFALNKDEMNQAAFLSDDYYATPYTFLPTTSAFYTEDVEKYDQDLDKAKELLEEAGVTDLTLKLGYIESDDAQSLQALLIQEQLGQIGITVELDSSDGTALSAQMQQPDNEYDMYLGGYIMGIDPDTFAPLFESEGAYNFMFYDNSEIDDLFEQGRTELDTEKRQGIYADLQGAIQDQASFYPIVSNNKILLVNNRIQGVDQAGLVPVYTFEDASYLTIED